MRSCRRETDAGDAQVDEREVEKAGEVTRNVGYLGGAVELRGRVDWDAFAVGELREEVGSLEDADEGVDVVKTGVEFAVVRLRQGRLALGGFTRRARNRRRRRRRGGRCRLRAPQRARHWEMGKKKEGIKVTGEEIILPLGVRPARAWCGVELESR